MRIVVTPFRMWLLYAMSTLLIGTAVQTDQALARPGTPTGFSLFNCPFGPSVKPRVCGNFVNAASEEVIFEMDLKKNNQSASQKIGCFNGTSNEGICWWPGQKYTRSKLERELKRPLFFEMTDLEFDTQYCARIRARRVSDSMVSEIWTGWSCARTPAAPRNPKPPEFTVKFEGRQSVPNGPSVPETLTVSYNKYEGAGALTLRVRKATGPDSYKREERDLYNREHGFSQVISSPDFSSKTDKVRIDPRSPWLHLEVCASNITGQTCSHKVVSVTAESVNDPTPSGGLPIRVTGSAKDGTGKEFQQGINLPGMDFKSQALRGNDPEACQQLCNNNAGCKAWTFVRGGVQSDRAMCQLKNGVPRAFRDANMVSGVKPVKKAPVTFNFDLPGKDYRQQHTTVFRDCEELCEKEAQCKAWTWSAPNVQGPKAVCSLKNDVPPRVARAKFAYGIKGDGAPPEASSPPGVTPNSSAAERARARRLR
jgi:hypothetical protein